MTLLMPSERYVSPEVALRRRRRRKKRKRRLRRETIWQAALGAVLVAVFLVVLILLGRNSDRWFPKPPDVTIPPNVER